MHFKKIMIGFLLLAMTVSVIGCSDENNKSDDQTQTAYKTEETETIPKPDTDIPEKTKKNIKQDILGCWSSGTAYMCFFKNGEVGMINLDTGHSDMLPYEVVGDTVNIYIDSEKASMYSVEVTKGSLLSYTSKSGSRQYWYAVSEEEVSDVLATLE